eukprot:5698603-Pyramimonas_sp.AAC.1
MSSPVELEEFDRVAIFAQPPGIRVDGTSSLRAPPKLDQHEMTTMNARLRNISMQDELLSACVAELSASGMSATDMEIVVE